MAHLENKAGAMEYIKGQSYPMKTLSVTRVEDWLMIYLQAHELFRVNIS